MSNQIKTGERVQVSGQYAPNGHKVEVTFVKGHIVPPYKGSTKFTLVDKTKH